MLRLPQVVEDHQGLPFLQQFAQPLSTGGLSVEIGRVSESPRQVALQFEIATMIELQLLTGMRPDEVTIIRPCDIEVLQKVNGDFARTLHSESVSPTQR